MTLTELITKLRELESKASPAEWHIGWVHEDSDAVDIDEPDLSLVARVHERKNQAFICDMRNALPTLIKVIEIYDEALKYYANDNKYNSKYEWVDYDNGSRATKALSEVDGLLK